MSHEYLELQPWLTKGKLLNTEDEAQMAKDIGMYLK